MAEPVMPVGSKERVALELASRIHNGEHPQGKPAADPRTYWLGLYAECLTTVRNGEYKPPEAASNSDPESPRGKAGRSSSVVRSKSVRRPGKD